MRRLNGAQWRMLRRAHQTGDPLHLDGKWTHDGGQGTRESLVRRGFLGADGKVTERGLDRLRRAGDLAPRAPT